MSRPAPATPRRRTRLLLSVAAAATAVLALPAAGQACTWKAGAAAATGCTAKVAGPTLRVSPTGNDQRGTGTAKAPFQSIPRALGALANAPSGTILLAAGDYPAFLDSRARTGTVIIRGAGTRTAIAGAKLYGSQGLRFENLEFSQRLIVNHHGVLGARQRSARVVLDGVAMTTGCVSVRNTDAMTVADSWLHACGQGISAPAGGGDVTGLKVTGNVIEDLTSDGLMIGNANGVTVSNNVIRNVHRVDGSTVHNDGIQLIGNVRRVVLSNNTISDSTGQLLFVSDDFGANDDVAVVNNLMYGAGAAAVQAGGTTKLRFIANTIWDGRHGGMILRRGYSQSVAPTVTLVNNLLSSLRFTSGATAAARGNAVTGCSADAVGVKCLPGVPFRDPAAGDFTIADAASLLGVADAALAPATDLRFVARATKTVPGALDAAATTTPRAPAAAARR